jgi:ABC-2 type transport system permease protein
MREANTLVDVSSFLVQGFSGSNFPVQSLPSWLIPVALALPLTYGLDAVRGWLLETQTILPLQVEIALLIVFMFVMLWFGSWVFYRVERRVRTLGTLGQLETARPAKSLTRGFIHKAAGRLFTSGSVIREN